MFRLLGGLTDPALRRLYKFVVKRLIGRFLVDELDLSQLDVRLRAGTIELHDLELDVDALNRSFSLPFLITKGSIGNIKVTMRYGNMLSESLTIRVEDVDICVVPWDAAAGGTAADTSTGDSGAAAQPSTSQCSDDEEDAGDTGSNSREGLDFIASWVDQICTKMKVEFSNVTLRFQDCAASASGQPAPCALVLNIPGGEYYDENSGWDEQSMMNSVSGKNRMCCA
jgi:autophagy-related protein 2